MNYIWSMISVVGVQLISMVASILIAREVGPDLIGAFNITFVYITLLVVIHEALLTSLIMFENIKKKDTLKISFSVTLILLIFLIIAGYILNDVYQTTSLLTFVLISSVGIIANSFFATEKIHHIKKENFRLITIIEILAEILSSILAYVLLMNNFLYIAVAFKISLRPLFGSCLMFYMSKKTKLSDEDTNNNFQKNMLSKRKTQDYLKSQVVIFFNNSIDYILIGKFFGLTNLGYYTIAYQWSVIFRQYISAAISRVLFPRMISYSKSDEISNAQKYFMKIFSLLAFASYAFLTSLFIYAGEFIHIFYGENWDESISILRILLLSAFMTTVASIGGSVINGFGKPEIEKNLNIISTILLIIIIIFSKNYTLEVVAWGILAKTIVMDSAKIYYVASLLEIKSKKMFQVVLKLISIPLMFIITYLTVDRNYDLDFIDNTVYVLVFLVVYLLPNKKIVIDITRVD